MKHKNAMLFHMEAFILSNRKRIFNQIVFAVDVSKDDKVFYTHTDSLYIKNKLVGSGTKRLVGEEKGRGKPIMVMVVFFCVLI